MRLFRAFVVGVAILAIASCTAVRVGEPYDAEIEAGLNSYYKAVVAFIKQAQLNAGKPEGRYGSPESNAFYSSAQATLADLRLRAGIVGGSRTCPTISLVETAIEAAGVELSETAATIDANAAPEPLDVTGNCTTIVVRNVELAHANLEADHMELGRISPTVASLNQQAIEAAVRVALQTVRSHR